MLMVGRMRGRQEWMLVILATLALLVGEASVCMAEPYQPHANFVAAIQDTSTSPYVVLLTAIDDRDGQAHSGCTTANLLRGAIYKHVWGLSGSQSRAEDELRGEEVRRILTENTSHVFHFSNPDALSNVLPFQISAHYPQACEAIARGIRVRIADLTGQPIFGPFAEGPQIIWRSCPSAPLPESDLSGLTMPTISLLIAPDGTSRETKVTNSSGSRKLDEAVRAALSACKFKPRTIDDRPVPEAAWFTMRISNRWPFAERNPP
jgi:TonB family protein